MVLTKMRNHLKRPTTCKKRSETTYNKQETTWSDLQQHSTSKKRPETTYNDLKRPITNKKRPKKRPTTSKKRTETTYNDPNLPTTSKEKMWNDQQQADFDFDYFIIWGNRFSSLTRFILNIWLQSFEHFFTENHGENRAPNISILSCVFITGYVANHFDTRKLTFAEQKSTLGIQQKKIKLWHR